MFNAYCITENKRENEEFENNIVCRFPLSGVLPVVVGAAENIQPVVCRLRDEALPRSVAARPWQTPLLRICPGGRVLCHAEGVETDR